MDTPTLVQFLTYLVGGGAIIAVSWVAEQFSEIGCSCKTGCNLWGKRCSGNWCLLRGNVCSSIFVGGRTAFLHDCCNGLYQHFLGPDVPQQLKV